MLVSEIHTRITRQFGDESGAQFDLNDTLRWINDAQKDIARASGLLQVTASSSTVIGTAAYALPASILSLRSVRFNGIVLGPLTINQAEELVNNYDAGTATIGTGVPINFWVWGGQINLYPIPNSVGTLKMYYVREPVEVTLGADTPELPVQFHPRIVEYCLAQAYELDNDRQGHATKMGQFTQGVAALTSLTEWQPQGAYPSVTISSDDIDQF